MELEVLGCHGGESPRHKTSSFVIDGRVTLDAGAVSSMLSLERQLALEAVLVSHAHLDHIKDLATLADNRCQRSAPPLVVAGTPETLAALRTHFFNGVIWPDFTRIDTGGGPTIELLPLALEERVRVKGLDVRAIAVHHTVDTCGFVVEGSDGAIAYTGDTGPTNRIWEVLRETPALKAILAEVSFPDDHHGLAKLSGHHTPETLASDLAKLGDRGDVPTLLYHLKPFFQSELERSLAKRFRGSNVEVCKLGDHFTF